MKVSTDTNFTSAKYTVSDADLGIVEGETVGSFEKIGWVGGFISGAYQSKDSRASSIQFHVEPPRAGSYTLKVIVFQSVSGNMRQSSIRINEDDSTIQNIGIGQLNQTRIAPVMDKKHNLSLATFEHVELNDGDNLVEISNKDGDAPEFVRAVFVDEKTAFEPGDVDHSGKIDKKDVTAALELASGKPGSAGDRLLADENGDGAVTAVDALLILKKATGGTGE